jgi:hypothetical protein
MALYKDLHITDNFYGVTEDKGDLIVNNGERNDRLPVGSNGFLLVADDTQPLGVKWSETNAPTISFIGSSLSNVPLSTNSTNFINIDYFDATPMVGDYVVLLSLVYEVSDSSEQAVFAVFKNGVIITDSARNVGIPSQGNRLSFGLVYNTNFSGADTYSVRFRSTSLDSTVTLYEGSSYLLRFTNSNQLFSSSTFSTNSNVPIEVTDLTATPNEGVYLILLDLVYEVNKNGKKLYIGIYKDDVLIPESERQYDTLLNSRTNAQIIVTTSVNGANTIKVKFYVDSNAEATVFDRNLVLTILS